ncbi:MAG: hypothetical protein AAGD10_16055 [Myxococcota bacterium]
MAGFGLSPLLWACLAIGGSDAASSAPMERGVALGLFSADTDFDYGPLVDEVASLGATHVSIVWVWWSEDVHDHRIRRKRGWSASWRQVERTIRQARARSLHVTAFPIVRLTTPDPDQWRGRIRPLDEDAWWASYEDYIVESARRARASGAQRLSVGSELLSRESMRPRWRRLIDRVRSYAPELELLYSANWDHFRPVSFWDMVDVVGLTGYWELTRDAAASEEALVQAWGPIRADVEAWAKELGRSFVITELGYPSIDGAAVYPWNDTREGSVDLEEQARAFRAFIRAWAQAPELQGIFIWNWFGFGGPSDRDYTPRGKPSAEVIRRWYGGGRSQRGG